METVDSDAQAKLATGGVGERNPGIDSSLPTPARAGSPSPLVSDSDLQSLLARAVQELATTSGGARVAAWSRDPTGRPIVLCARLEGSELREPDEACYAAAAALEEPTDLGRRDRGPGLRRIVEEHGLTAAAPVHGGEARAAAVLLMGGERDAPGHVRPRTLAALGAAARRLDAPVAAAAAAQRLARVGAEVQRMHRLAALGSLVAEIVHEIRNPLVSVKTFLQLLPERLEDREFRESFLEVASDELRRVERLLDVVLEQGRPAASRPEPGAEVPAAFDSVAQLVGFRAAERGVDLSIADPGALPPVHLSEDALRQVVLNLTLNAIEVTPPGGAVRLDASETASGVEIAVDDEGPGIDPALRPHLFEPFFSTKGDRPGGLGLSITRRIVEDAGGSVAVHDRSGPGSSFRARLPRA